MADNQPNRNDQAAGRSDGNAPGTWPGSGTTVEGHVETSTTGIFGEPGDDPARGSASTSAGTVEPEDVLPDERADEA